MNCLLILISILSFIASVLGEIQAFIYCPIECSAMLNCFIALENQVNLSIIQFFPPKNDEFGKCNCQNVAQYIECLNCYYIKKNIQSISEDNIKSHCARIENPTVLTNTDISSEISINENNNRNNKTPDNDIENNKDDNKKSNSSDTGIDKGLIIFSAFIIAGGVIGFIYYQYPTSRKKNDNSFMIINENDGINDISSMVINENMTTIITDISNPICSSDKNKNILSTTNNNN